MTAELFKKTGLVGNDLFLIRQHFLLSLNYCTELLHLISKCFNIVCRLCMLQFFNPCALLCHQGLKFLNAEVFFLHIPGHGAGRNIDTVLCSILLSHRMTELET
jgi:hypothetical protein